MSLVSSIANTVRLALRRLYEIRKEGLIEVLDEHGSPTGELVHIYDIHERSLWHRTANVYVVNSKNEVLLQKRSSTIRVFPNMWTMSAGGHIRAGHTPLQTAVAELKEELDLDIAPEEFISFAETTKDEAQQNGTLRDREFHSNYIVHADVDIDTLKMQVHEVADLEWMPVEEYRAVIASNDPTHVHHASLSAFFAYIDAHKN